MITTSSQGTGTNHVLVPRNEICKLPLQQALRSLANRSYHRDACSWWLRPRTRRIGQAESGVNLPAFWGVGWVALCPPRFDNSHYCPGANDDTALANLERCHAYGGITGTLLWMDCHDMRPVPTRTMAGHNLEEVVCILVQAYIDNHPIIKLGFDLRPYRNLFLQANHLLFRYRLAVLASSTIHRQWWSQWSCGST